MDYYHQLKNKQLNFDILIPFLKFESELVRELALKNIKIFLKTDKIFFVEPIQNKNIIWAQDHWPDCVASDINTDLVKYLKTIPYIGYYHKTENNRKAEHMLSKLKTIPQKRIKYSSLKKFNFKFYIWTTYQDLVIYCLNPKSTYPAGWHEFEEDKDFPPNRAYLKLWEVFTLHDIKISNEDEAIEIGASPGGWSWVLSQKCKKVHTFDRADLAPQVKKIKNIEHRIGDAFKVDPKQYKNCTWFFSDLICSPEKILETIQFWLDHSPVKNFVCTVKFKGECNFEVIDKLLKIPDSIVVKLYQNKHEVTWIKQQR